MNTSIKPVALVTGGSAGLGRALTHALAERGWQVVTDARDPVRLHEAVDGTSIRGVAGDIADPIHREALAEEVRSLGRLDLLVHNASTLGPTPMRALAETTGDQLSAVLTTNAVAPYALTNAVLPLLLEADGVLLSLSSDAAVGHYETWGLYAASKAALDQLTLTFGAETGLAAYAVDPGDMRTEMHQAAFPGEDISDRPEAGSVVPALLSLLDSRPPTGRYRAADLALPGGVLA